ncbi:hypothetical protein [Thalassobacillus devorans]|uniref:hypothetical protein n=1 Tax=Thalassobacillus devorans TaxID=279813 RepID=UPI0004916129|nr:hypothetical protein [Thalassobacillus devorans]
MKLKIFLAGLFILLLLTGCLYPENRLSKNSIPSEVQLENVQRAIDSYREQENGLLPIKTKGEDTPIFQKYVIDFKKLKEKRLISEIPGNAFENGGVYQYVLIHPEDDPTVKLIDLRMTEQLRSLRYDINRYQQNNQYLPYKSQVAQGIYDLDYKKLGLDAPMTVTSPYSHEPLPVYIKGNGDLLIDYRKDLYNFLKNKEHSYKKGDDIRYLLVNHSPFVPVYSPAYTIEDGEPIFMSEA